MFPQQEPSSGAPEEPKQPQERSESDPTKSESPGDASRTKSTPESDPTKSGNPGDASRTKSTPESCRTESGSPGDESRTKSEPQRCRTESGSPGDASRTKSTPQRCSGPFPSAALPIAPSRLRDIEERLLCADQADAELESGEPGPPTGPPAGPAGPPAAAQPPEPGDSRWLGAGAALRAALREGSARCRQRDFAAAAAKFSVALELCSKGFATEDPLKSSPAEISRLASWIESKLVICYLRLGQPGLALLHSHRSIIENPSHFCNHLRQAACFRCLHRYSEAARSAMVAQCLYVLAEGAGLDTSDLLQLYWQAMTQEALSAEMSFCALYTPFEKEGKADKIKEANKTFAERHPEYVQHIFTDPHGIHLLPEKAESRPGQQYLLTLGFRNREIGKTLEKLVTQKMPIFPGQKITWSSSVEEEAETFWQNSGKMIMAALAFIGSTKIKDERGPCARAIEHLHHASLLGQLHRAEEQAQVLRQGMAELATVPHLQRVSQEEDKLLQSLMADAVDILAGRTGERAWAKIHKVALIEEYLREAEEFYFRPPRLPAPGVENISWTPKGRRYLRLENTNVFIPNPRSLATGLKKRRILFAKS